MTHQLASAVADWPTVLRSAEALRFSRVVSWDGRSLWFAEFAPPVGRLSRDIVIEPGTDAVRTVEEADV